MNIAKLTKINLTVREFKKSSVSDVEYDGHIWNTGQLNGAEGADKIVVDLLPISNKNYYKREGANGLGIVYREHSSTDLTENLETNGGSNVFIRKSNKKKNIQPSLCPKTHCPAPFQFSIG